MATEGTGPGVVVVVVLEGMARVHVMRQTVVRGQGGTHDGGGGGDELW